MTTFPRSSNIVAQYAGPVTLFVGTSLPNLTLELIYTNGGGPVVLKQGDTDATAMCAIARKGTPAATVSPTATVLDSNNGLVDVVWDAFQFTSPGLYEGQVEVTMPDGTVLPSQKFLLEVFNKVGGL